MWEAPWGGDLRAGLVPARWTGDHQGRPYEYPRVAALRSLPRLANPKIVELGTWNLERRERQRADS